MGNQNRSTVKLQKKINMNIKEALTEILNDEEALNNKPKHPRFWQIEHTWDFPFSIFYNMRRLSS